MCGCGVRPPPETPLVSSQKLPGVRDARRPSITAKTYAILIMLALAIFAAAMLVLSHLVNSDDATGDAITFDLATPAATSCTYQADSQQMVIRAHLDATTRNSTEVVLTAGVHYSDTGDVVAKTEKALYVNGHLEADYTFLVDVPQPVRTTEPTACFVEAAANG